MNDMKATPREESAEVNKDDYYIVPDSKRLLIRHVLYIHILYQSF